MARIRSIKPEFWDDRKLAKRTSRDARLLYIALWNLADEHCRLNGDPQWIKGQVFSYDDDIDATVIAKLLEELAAPALGAVIVYEVDEDPYLYLPKLAKHQRLEPDKVKSRLPDPPDLSARGGDEGALPVSPSESDPDESARDPDESARGANQSAQDVDKPALSYVAGSKEHVAGGMSARERGLLANSLLDEHTKQISPPPPRDRTRRTGEQIDRLLDDPEMTADDIRDGLALWRTKPHLGPSVLPDLVHEVRQKRNSDLAARPSVPGNRRQQETDDMFDRAMQRAQRREQDQ
jgi:hypothetical protein